MIRLLFKKYRIPIIMAFALVIVENVTFIAEPYIFGQAIDDLREANRIENEVDSSVTNSILQQTIDSVRDYLLDSLGRRDSVIEEDSLTSSNIQNTEPRGQNPVITFARYQLPTHRFQRSNTSPRERLRRRKRDSLKIALDQNIRTLERSYFDSSYRRALSDTTISPMLAQGVFRTLKTRDTINKLVKSGKTALLKKRTPSRDSLRLALKKIPHERRQVIGKKKKEPVSFLLPRELGPFIPPLIPWIVLFVISSVVGGVRRVYDTKVYTRMFADLSSSVVAQQLHKGEDLSKIAGRSSLAWQNIEFFQYNLPEFIEQIINVGGAVGALAIFDWRLATVGGGIVLLVLLSSQLYMSRIARVQTVLNDLHEQEYNMFATKDPAVIRNYYSDISKLEISFSNTQAGGFGILRILLLVMFMMTLYISLDLDRFTIGELYSIVAYLWTFVTASEYIPYLSEKWVALKDVTGRIQSDEWDAEPAASGE
ncbi:MAG TPA: ABC transporter six-transmembrane domain-containing protein [Candidatus Kapabacteria bacterium]|nr:ABC transporter six-transmembrane domain-containing protein [Candidatus Kapabacteria bacterium]